MTASLTIIALARNEARHLSACFRSLELLKALTGAKTLVVLDSRANSVTTDVAHRVADRVVTSKFVSFAVQRNRALDLAQSDWVFFIDPDERCTRRLAEEFSRTLNDAQCAAYGVPRRNFFFGHEVRHTGWWPDYQIRLLRRDRCRFDESRPVHELAVVRGEIGYLDAPLIHFNYQTWGQFITKQRAYARLDARAMYEAGRRASLRSIVGQPLRELKRRLVDYQGYKDGPLGVALSIAMALYVAETQRQLLKLQRA